MCERRNPVRKRFSVTLKRRNSMRAMQKRPPTDNKMKYVKMVNQTVQRLCTITIGLSFVAGVSLSTIQAQPAEFAPFEVEYEVGNNHINAGSALLQLEKSGSNWIYSLKTKPTGVFKLTGKGNIQEISEFTVSSSTDSLELKPQRYTYRQDKETRRSVDAWFDWSKNQLTFKRRGEETSESINGPLVDRLSVTLTVIDALQRQGFEQTRLNVFDNGRVKTMLFTNEGVESVETRMGKLETIRVRSAAVGGGTRHTTTWFAPQLGYVPVKIEQFKREKLVARLTLSTLRNHITESGGAEAYSTK